MKPVQLASEAVEELVEAAGFYESKRVGLGAVFLDEGEDLISVIGERPLSFPRLERPSEPVVRRALLSRFPYGLVFFDIGHEIRVVAVAHAKRDPGYWLHRLS